jgi:16S rRNA (uracil1498-N3)-methyltransferase
MRENGSVSAPRFFVPGLDAALRIIALPHEEAHHVRHVLRLGAGAGIAVFDGRGGEWAGRIISADKRAGVTVELAGRITPAAEPPVRVTLGIGLLKGDQMDAVIRDATMLGVAEIAPVESERVTVPSRGRHSAAAAARWQRVAVASAKQCGRAVVPAITPVEPLAALLARSTAERRLMCVEPAHAGARPVALEALARPSTALALVGPEGGWSAEEIASAVRRDVGLVHLGPRTLRAETAPTVLLSALWTRWGW